MSDLISREALMKFPIRIDHYDKENGSLDFVLGIESVLEYAESLPAVDAVEVVHAKWVDRYGGNYANPLYECSECNEKALYKVEADALGNERIVQALTAGCPHCFARMDGE